jgi:hypothetical protein
MQPPPQLDPALPALPLAFAFEAVAQQLEKALEAAEGRPITVTRARPLDVKYEPGVRCLVAYGLVIGGVPRETIGVVEVDRAGARARLLHEDAALPGLGPALDAEVMRARFAALQGGAIATDSIRECAIATVRYKPNVSCVLRYRITAVGGEASVFGKLVAGRARELASTLAGLETVSGSEPLMPRIPTLVGFWPDLELVAQLAAPGQSLGTAIFDRGSRAAVRRRLMRRAGHALGAFHTCVDAPAARRTLSDDLVELQGYRELFVRLAAELAGSFDHSVDALATLARDLPEPAAVASHGALRTGHYLVGRSDMALIDLDGFCSANAARDVGNLLAYLDWLTIRNPNAASLVKEAERDFLAGYEAVAKLPTDWLPIYRTASMLKIAGRRLRSLSFDEWGLLPALLGCARSSLAMSPQGSMP